MRRTLALAAALAALTLGLVAASGSNPAAAGNNLGTVSATPETTLVGQTVTVTPSAPCPEVSTQAEVFYFLDNGDLVDTATVPVGADGSWTDTVVMDHAGDYFVDAECQHLPVAANAGHLAVAGQSVVFDGYYNEDEFHVNGTVVASPNPALPAQTVTFTPGTGSTCAPPTGTVTLTITDPDGAAVVTNATPTVAGDGSFSLQQALTKVGTYTVTGTCHRELPLNTLQSGHLAAAQPATATNDFTYTGTAVVAAAPTTTTAPPAAAAEAVTATPRFTG